MHPGNGPSCAHELLFQNAILGAWTNMQSLQEEFAAVEILEASRYKNLTVFPLLRRTPSIEEPDYVLLEDAINQGKARVTEVSGNGTVSDLLFENSSPAPVLLLAGEELVGAKQNRVLNVTVLAPPSQKVTIPVSCVEAGRWSGSTADFRAADHVMYGGLRAQQAFQVTKSMRASGSRRSDQAAVWDEVAAKLGRMGAKSPTQAVSAIYERHASSIEEFVNALGVSRDSHQHGIAYAINGRVLGLDLFDCSATFRRFSKKLLRSIALDALDGVADSSECVKPDAVQRFIKEVVSSQMFAEEAVGMGKDVRVNSPEISGAALWVKERYLHICAFRHTKMSNEDGFVTRLSRSWFRQRS